MQFIGTCTLSITELIQHERLTVFIAEIRGGKYGRDANKTSPHKACIHSMYALVAVCKVQCVCLQSAMCMYCTHSWDSAIYKYVLYEYTLHKLGNTHLPVFKYMQTYS